MCFSKIISVFHGRSISDTSTLVGYGALIDYYSLAMPMPYNLAVISEAKKNKVTEDWTIYEKKYQPEDTLYKQLVFAVKHEGINLLFFKKLFQKIGSNKVVEVLQNEPLGQYTRKIWFLYEWLLDEKLPIEDLKSGNYVPLINDKKQFCIAKGVRSRRHRIVNNLPGTPDFCHLVSKTEKLKTLVSKGLDFELGDLHKDVLQRTAAFLLLKDSKASFTIEGENPINKRANRWGQAIGQAGLYPLDQDELIRLQQIVIENPRFIEMGLRTKGGFVGEHDRASGEPIPEHISAKYTDLQSLTSGLVEVGKLLNDSEIDPVVAASIIAFGFVYMHPFEDGNGRIHRYLVHHVLQSKGVYKQGVIFPVSAVILDDIDKYRLTLESYSKPLLDFIEWEETTDHNIEVTNDTADYYKYIDVTKQTEFLYACVDKTINEIIPKEVDYLIAYDTFKNYIDDAFEMPDRMVATLVRFLTQNNGKLSKRAKTKEFIELTESEVDKIEKEYQLIFEL